MYKEIGSFLAEELEQIKKDGLFKSERVISGPQGADVALTNGAQVINLCSNNYLGLSAHPEVIKAAKDTLDTHGFGMSSVRFICGTQDIHKTLEQKMLPFTKRKTPFYTLRLLMQTGAYLSRYLALKMRLFQMP